MSISIAETATLLRMSQQEVYQQIKNGQLKSRCKNGQTIITQDGLLEYLIVKQRATLSEQDFRSRCEKVILLNNQIDSEDRKSANQSPLDMG